MLASGRKRRAGAAGRRREIGGCAQARAHRLVNIFVWLNRIDDRHGRPSTRRRELNEMAGEALRAINTLYLPNDRASRRPLKIPAEQTVIIDSNFVDPR